MNNIINCRAFVFMAEEDFKMVMTEEGQKSGVRNERKI